MSVFDTAAVVDYLLGTGSARGVAGLLEEESEGAAPDLLVFDVLAVLRRQAGSGDLSSERATAAVADLGDVPIELWPSLSLRGRAWELRENFTAADALFLALCEELGERLVTADRRLARAARELTGIEVVEV